MPDPLLARIAFRGPASWPRFAVRWFACLVLIVNVKMDEVARGLWWQEMIARA